jgi:catechol 2,3-dioxygenase-like lactoylglutathione lyase family enzyme
MVVAGDDGMSSRGNPFGHIDLRVPSMAEALAFYEALLPALGFTRRYDGPEWKVFATEVPPPAAAYFGITESASHVPNENRIAFWAADRSEVERIAEIVAGAGGQGVSGPKQMPYGPGYYTVYFTDPGGNPFEVYHRPPR